MRNEILTGFVTAVSLVPTVTNAKSNVKVDQRPNVLFIITDQQRYDALGVAGVFPFLKTPNLDNLSRESAYFTNAYTPCAVSGPARSALLTGLLVEHTNVLTNELTSEDPVVHNFTTEPTFDQILTKEGYYTEYHGKYHSPIGWSDCYSEFKVHNLDKKKPFSYRLDHFIRYFEEIAEFTKNDKKPDLEEKEFGDKFFNVGYTADPIDRRYIYGTDKEGNAIINAEHSRKHAQPDNHGLLHLPDSMSMTAYQAKEAIAALKRASVKDEPFSITLSINFPHAPMLPTEKYYNMYNVEDMPVPVSIADEMIDSPYQNNQNGRLQATEYRDPEKIVYMMKNYFGLISEIDYWVGEVLATLDELGQEDNTIVVFVSDHGEMLGSHGMREKNVFLQESARVPLMVRYPNKIQPCVIERNVSTLNLFSTIMDYTGVKCEKRDGSSSLRRTIEGKNKDANIVVTEWLYNGERQPSHMIVKDDWKLFLNYSKESTVTPVLFNLTDDPYEMNNLIGKSNAERLKYVDKANELKVDLEKWLDENNSKYGDMLREVKL